MKLSVIIPAFNEEETILKVLQRLNETKVDSIEYEFIVINDGSTDNTKKILDDNQNLFTTIINNEKNSGKGYSVKEGLKIAKGDYIIFQDADLEYDPLDFKKFIKICKDFDADVILGSRFNYSEYTRSHNALNKIGNRILTFIFNILYNTTFTDIYSCYACFKKELLNVQSLKTEGFEQHAEILGKIIRRGKKFYEVPINYNGRTHEEGKKIKFHHIFPVIFQIIKGRIN
jgi:glycosyltransferase involved in cell wall biosynthesis